MVVAEVVVDVVVVAWVVVTVVVDVTVVVEDEELERPGTGIKSGYGGR